MALNPDSAGFITEPIVHEYVWKDVALYALAIGAGPGELDFLYESRGPKVFPSFAVVPAFEAARAAYKAVGGDPLGIVHLGQKIVLHKPFAGSGRLTSIGRVGGVYDLKKMALAVIATETRDASDDLVCETEFSIIFRLDGNFGGDPPPRRPKHRPPDRDPDFVLEQTTSTQQAALYRLCGDDNPLHIDPDIAARAGFGTPILHGLCTFGFVCRAVLSQAAGGDPTRLKTLAGEFKKPVWPGDTLVTRGWNEPKRVILRTSTRQRPDELAFGSAYAELI